MIKHWQSHQKYLHFLKHVKTRLDSSQRVRWRILLPVRKRLKALDLDPAGEFLLPSIPIPADRPSTRLRSCAPLSSGSYCSAKDLLSFRSQNGSAH